MKRLLGVFLSVLLLSPLFCNAEVKVVAHRGHWQEAGSAQNSIKSLVKADSIGAYASEFDVWRSRDGKLFCNHDKKFKGVTLEEADSGVIEHIVLDNGEKIPTLRDMLVEAKNLPGLRLVLELKEHSNNDVEAQAARECVEMVTELGLENRTDYITFSKNALECFIKHAPTNATVYYLTGDMTPEEVHSAGANGIDYNIRVFRKHPDWIDRAHALGMRVNVWTVNDPEDIKWCIDQGIDLITTNCPEAAQELIKSRK